jgi:hypothetical protein
MTDRVRFAHHEKEVWRKLSDELGGSFQDDTGWRNDEVRIRDGEWTVTLSFVGHRGARLDAIYTRFRAPYVNPEKVRFELYHQEWAHRLAHLLGWQDVQIGDPRVDKMFVVKASDEAKVKELLSAQAIRDLLVTEKSLHVAVRDAEKFFHPEFPEGVDELVVEVPDKVADLARLERLYRLFAAILHALGRHSSAYRRDTLIGG